VNGPPNEYAELVLEMVERIPPGRVMSYGMIAECLRDQAGRGSARTVGTVMSRYGGGVPWHRVVAGDGGLPPGHEAKARARLEAEGVPFRGRRVEIASVRWWPDHDPEPAAKNE
jgi:methylated-DNA-protein-cysteine methyltransferase related protein